MAGVAYGSGWDRRPLTSAEFSRFAFTRFTERITSPERFPGRGWVMHELDGLRSRGTARPQWRGRPAGVTCTRVGGAGEAAQMRGSA